MRIAILAALLLSGCAAHHHRPIIECPVDDRAGYLNCPDGYFPPHK